MRRSRVTAWGCLVTLVAHLTGSQTAGARFPEKQSPLTQSQWPAPRMMADIQQEWNPDFGNPVSVLVGLDSVGYFTASDGIHGSELWRSDGTPEGTWMVRDLCPGECSGLQSSTLSQIGAALYFFADSGDGWGLWSSDGTAENTVKIQTVRRDRRSGFCEGQVSEIAAGFLLVADDGVHGCELWLSDGTASGTNLVTDLVTGPNSLQNRPQRLRPIDSEGAVFVTRNGVWRTDGTASGTTLLAALDVPVNGISGAVSYGWPTTIGDLYYFMANDGIHGIEPWRTDGTLEGTQRLVDSAPGSSSSATRFYVLPIDESAFFISGSLGSRSLWRSTGSPESTEPFFGPLAGHEVQVKDVIGVAGGRLYFTATQGDSGWELWSTDGTAESTGLVEEIAEGSVSSVTNSYPEWVTSLGDRLVFPANDLTHGRELWTTDESCGQISSQGSFTLSSTSCPGRDPRPPEGSRSVRESGGSRLQMAFTGSSCGSWS